MKKFLLAFKPFVNTTLPQCFVGLIVVIFYCSNTFAQVTVLYKQQTGNYTAGFYSSGAGNGIYNPNSFQMGMFSNSQPTNQVVAWRTLKTAGDNTGSARSLQVGDQFRISVSAHTVRGQMGFALLASPSSRASYTDGNNNALIAIDLDSYGNWYAKLSSGNTSGSANVGGTTTYKNFVFICLLTAPDRMNVSISDGTTTSNMYDLLLNSSNPITEYAVYMSDDYDGTSSNNIYWNTNSTSDADYVKNTLGLPIGISNSSFIESNVIPDGLTANTIATASVNALTKSGTGTLTLSASNSYTGATTISNGILKLGVTGSATNTPLGTIAAGTTVSSGGTLDLAGFTLGTSEAINISGTGYSTNGAIMNSGGAATYSGSITLGANSTINGGSGSIILNSATAISGAGNTFTLGGATGGTVSSIIAITTGGLTKSDAGTWILSGANTYTGTTTINTGTLQLGITNAIKTGSTAVTRSSIVLAGGTLSSGAGAGFSDGNSANPMGTLTLNNNATIALGTSNNLYFAASNGVAWAASPVTLTITGWTGIAGSSGTSGHIFIGASIGTLTAQQLSQITFSGYAPGATLLTTGPFAGQLVPAITPANYFWIGGATTSGWNTASNWSATRGGGAVTIVNVNSGSTFIFDGTCLNTGCAVTSGNIIVTDGTLGTGFTVAQIILQNTANVTYKPSAAFDITVNGSALNNGGSGSDFDIGAASIFSFGAGVNPIVTLATGATGVIFGTVNIGVASAQTHQLVGTDASSITFGNGAVCNVNGSATDYPFGQGTAGSVIFASGSILYHTKSLDIFGGTGNTVVTFQHGSTYEYDGTNGSYISWAQSTTDRVYSNFVFNNTGGATFIPTSTNITVDSLIFKSTMAGTVDIQNSANQTLTILGNLSNYCTTKSITFDPSGTGDAINFSGSSVQTLYNAAAAGNLNFGNTSASRSLAINIISGSTLNLGNTNLYTGNFQLITPAGGSATTTFTVKTGGTLNTGTSVISGPTATKSGTFICQTGSTVITGHLNGLSTTAGTGAIQATTLSYNSGANYTFNATTGAQLTGNFIASTTSTVNTVNNLTINNTSGVTFNIASGTVNVSGTLYLTNGIFNTITNNAVAIVPSGASVSRINGWVYGSLEKYVAASGTTTFEVGDASYYTNVNVSAATGAGLFTVKTNVHGDHPNIGTSDIDPSNDENTYWTLTNNAATFSSGATLVFNYPNGDMDIPANATSYKLGNYNAGTWTYPLSLTAAANSLTVTGITVFGDFECGAPVCGTFGTWKGTTSTEWNLASNWCGGIPTSTTNVIIPNVANKPVISTASAVANSITINSGATLTMNGVYNLTISTNGSFTNNAGNGGFVASSSTGALILSGNLSSTTTISGTTNFQNVSVSGGVDFGTASTINGTFTINATGFVTNNHPPIYSCSSILSYNTGGTYNRNQEWTAATSGAGYPGSVQVASGTTLNYNNSSTGINGSICGDLTINAGGNLDMDYGTTGNSTLTVGGNTLVNGSLSLGYSSGGDLYMYGNFTIGASGVVNYNTVCRCPSNTGGGGRALQFLGNSPNQIITYTPGGTLTIPIININKGSGNVQLATGTNIIIPDYGSNNNSLKLLNAGGLDLNGQTLTMYGSPNGAGYYIGILASGGTRTITGSAGSTLAITAASFWAGVSAVSVDTAGGGKLVTDLNVLVTTNVGFAPSRFTTINGTLQLNQLGGAGSSNGFIADLNNYVLATSGLSLSGHCIYGSSSTLINSDNGTFSRNIEWDATGIGSIGVTPGFPNNVIINNNTVYNIGDAASTSGIADRALNGSLTIQSGSSVQMGTMDNGAHHLYVAGDVNISGTLQLSTGITSTSPTAGDIYVGGNWTRNTGGVFDYNSANPRAVTFNNATSGTITAPASTGETFPYAYLSKTNTSAKITLADSVTILNQLGLNEGILDLSNSNLTIVSGRYNTANIGTTVTPSNVSLPYSGTGRFVVERFFPARRAWRLVTAPFNSTGIQTINQAWQEGVINSSNTPGGIVNPVPGYGTLITGPYNGTAGAPFGFDPGTQPNPSIYYYNNGPWAYVPNTYTTNVNTYPGFLLFVRGSRNYIIGTQFTPADTATLDPKGEINVGSQTTSAPAAGFQIIGNPYASAFNFSTATRAGLGNTIYEWDAQLTGTNSIGAMVTLTWNGAYYSCAPVPVGPIDTLLGRVESGSAFFVNFASAGSLTIKESDKTSANALVFRPATNSNVSIRANLYALNADSTTSLNDGVLTLFDPSYNNDVDIDDATKFTTISENIALKRNAHLLAIELRKPIVANDSIFYSLSKLNVKNYRLQLVGDNLVIPGLSAYLIDTLLHTSKQIDLNSTTNVDFNIPDKATAAQSAGRFIIVFKQASGGSLPVTFTEVNAWQKDKNSDNIIVNWKVENELNIGHYEVQRSFDGKNFSSINNTAATGNNHSNEVYNYLDADTKKGDNYYRIKSVGIDGAIIYSRTVKVNIGNNEAGITIYPNPIINGVVAVQLNNMQAGHYNFTITNPIGQTIAAKQADINVSNATENITLKQPLANGAYNLQVIDARNNKTTIPFIIQ